MTNKSYATRAGLVLGIGGILLWLFACSEQPNQTFENTKPLVNEQGHDPIHSNTQPVAQHDKAMSDLIMALKETKMALRESEILLRNAPSGKNSDVPLQALERELQAAEGLLKHIRETIEQGDYRKAKAQIHEITDKTNHLNQRIKLAIRNNARSS